MKESPPLAALTASSEVERERAWRAFYTEHFHLVYRLVIRSGTPPGEAEDLAQRVFLVAHRRLNESVQVEYPAAWLRGIVLRVVAESRRKRRLMALKRTLFAMGQPERQERTPEHTTEAARAQALVGRILDKMPRKLSEVLILTEMEGMKPGEVAELLSTPVNTIRSRKRLARDEFQKHYRRLMGSEAGDG